MGTYLVLVALIILIITAIMNSKLHFSGQGDCCGGGPVIKESKQLSGPIIKEITLDIEGMTCDKCAVRIENTVNRIDGALCHVYLNENKAIVSMDQIIDTDSIAQQIIKLGYKVKG